MLPFRAPGSSFFWLFLFLLLFSSLTLPIPAFHLSILSEVWLPNFLRQLQLQLLRYTTTAATTIKTITTSTTLQLRLQLRLQLQHCNLNNFNYINYINTTTTITTTTTTALHHTTSRSCEWGDRCNHSNHSKKHNSNHLSVHQWIRSAIRESQQPTLPVGFLFLKLPPPPCAVLLVYIYIYSRFWCCDMWHAARAGHGRGPSHLSLDCCKLWMQRYGRNAALSKTSDLGRTGRTGRPGPTAGFKGDGFVMTRLVTKHFLADSVTSDHEGKINRWHQVALDLLVAMSYTGSFSAWLNVPVVRPSHPRPHQQQQPTSNPKGLGDALSSSTPQHPQPTWSSIKAMRGEITKANLGVDKEIEHHRDMWVIKRHRETRSFQLIGSVLVAVPLFVTSAVLTKPLCQSQETSLSKAVLVAGSTRIYQHQ